MITRPAIFQWRQTGPNFILCAVRWYLRYSLSLRDVEELLEERGLNVDHTTVWRWVQYYGPELEQRLRRYRKATNKSWRVPVAKMNSTRSDSFLTIPHFIANRSNTGRYLAGSMSVATVNYLWVKDSCHFCQSVGDKSPSRSSSASAYAEPARPLKSNPEVVHVCEKCDYLGRSKRSPKGPIRGLFRVISGVDCGLYHLVSMSCITLPKWHGRDHRFVPDDVHQLQ
jgi:hypothetical protein